VDESELATRRGKLTDILGGGDSGSFRGGPLLFKMAKYAKRPPGGRVFERGEHVKEQDRGVRAGTEIIGCSREAREGLRAKNSPITTGGDNNTLLSDAGGVKINGGIDKKRTG